MSKLENRIQNLERRMSDGTEDIVTIVYFVSPSDGGGEIESALGPNGSFTRADNESEEAFSHRVEAEVIVNLEGAG